MSTSLNRGDSFRQGAVRKQTPRAAVAALLFLLVCASCQTRWDGDASLRDVPGEVWFRTELYFGNAGVSSEISESDWQRFVAEIVTPRFPAGLTVVAGSGQWQDRSGQIRREGARVLILLHPAGSGANEKIEQLRTIYCARFQQESVLRVTSLARVSTGISRAPDADKIRP
jgi:hypothetical protein